jgi:peroxiredoxin
MFCNASAPDARRQNASRTPPRCAARARDKAAQTCYWQRMSINIGDRIPDATLSESTEFGDACPVAPSQVGVQSALKGKLVVIFGLPGAFTPTCSAKHVPGYVNHLPELKAKKVDEVWCVSVNDGFVMAAWGREQHAIGKVRMLGDGGADFARKLGLTTEIPGMGVRLKRFSMLIDDGVVKSINVEAPGKFEVSDAETMLKQLG